MATIKKIRINRNWSTRPTDNGIYVGDVWFVEKGEPYDLIQFSINELDMGYFWHTSLCVPCGISDEDALKMAEEYAKDNISQKSIDSYKHFLEYGQKYGWD